MVFGSKQSIFSAEILNGFKKISFIRQPSSTGYASPFEQNKTVVFLGTNASWIVDENHFNVVAESTISIFLHELKIEVTSISECNTRAHYSDDCCRKVFVKSLCEIYVFNRIDIIHVTKVLITSNECTNKSNLLTLFSKENMIDNIK